MVSAPRVIRFEDSIADYISHLLGYHAVTITLVVCSTRDRFLEQLWACVCTSQPWAPQSDHFEQHNGSDPPLGPVDQMHPLLNRSLGLISRSRRVKLVFCPTVDNIRAFLSILHVDKHGLEGTGESKHRGMLAILDLIALHHMTTEFSAQGLSRTLAIAVEAAANQGVNLMLTECMDAVDKTLERGERLWHMHVPLLSDAVKIGDSRHTHPGRSVSVKRVAERWFRSEDTTSNNIKE
jgi:hypothetical protein